MDKLKMSSSNIVNENIEFIASRFPNVIVEVKDENGKIVKAVDFDILKQELSSIVVDGDKERYTMTWPDKKQAILTANAPIAKTLRPVVSDETTPTGEDSCKKPYISTGSVGKDGTNGVFDSENLYIEGDNLDVLKLLRETYLGQIKMIYIDPPYNTGNDFVYNDDFATDTEDYLIRSNQVDEEGNRMVANNDSNGRFHTDWLNMIYPRLRLARDLLKDDGVIFISIDNNEINNLRKVCDEIFGSRNCVTDIIWRKSSGSGNDSKYVMVEHEYILMYAKDIEKLKLNNEKMEISDDTYTLSDEYVETRGKYCLSKLDRGSKGYVASLDYGITAPDGSLVFPNGRSEQFNDGWRWMWSKSKVEWGIENGFIVVKKTSNNQWAVYSKQYAYVDNENKPLVRTKLYKSHIGFDEKVLNISANAEMKQIFGNACFSYPKPTLLLKKLCKMLSLEDNIILDFFSGSATTAHSIMQLNAEDGGNRKFIMIQLPEITDEKSEAYKAGYKNICEIGKERIRRAGKQLIDNRKNYQKDFFGSFSKDLDEKGLFGAINDIKAKKDNGELDIGFRVLKLDSSCMKDVYYNPADIKQDLLAGLEDNIKEDRTAEDLLFQVMLDMGVLLSSEIKVLDIKGKKVFNVNDGNLICCFDKNLTEEVVAEIAQLKPLYAVFRDSSMSSDSVAVNFDQIFETYSPTTTRKII